MNIFEYLATTLQKRVMAFREIFFLPTARVSCKRIFPIIENSWGQRMAQEECVEPESSWVSGKGVTWARWKFRVHGNGEVATSCALQRAQRSLSAIEFSMILFQGFSSALATFLFASFEASEMFTFYVHPLRLPRRMLVISS